MEEVEHRTTRRTAGIATVKQLQSQINPHFFYNCLFFIVSMSRLGQNKAVEAMATNLGDYFRYTTRVENQDAAIREELGLVNNYLEIQKLRQQLTFDIDVPEDVQELVLPRLTLQPLVENAIVHGLEPNGRPGYIRISGKLQGEFLYLHVEDDGDGMKEGALQALRQTFKHPLTEETGCGLWNVHQRLLYTFGGQSGIALSRSSFGGLKASLIIHRSGGQYDRADDR